MLPSYNPVFGKRLCVALLVVGLELDEFVGRLPCVDSNDVHGLVVAEHLGPPSDAWACWRSNVNKGVNIGIWFEELIEAGAGPIDFGAVHVDHRAHHDVDVVGLALPILGREYRSRRCLEVDS